MSTNEPPPPPPPPPPAAPTGGYSAGTAWRYGWDKFIANLGQILLAVIVLAAVLIALNVVGYLVGRAVACDPTVNPATGEVSSCGGLFSAQNLVQWLFTLVSWVIEMIIGAGIVRGALAIVEGRDLEPGMLLTPHRLGEVIIVSLVTGILTFVGLILCVIPGLLVAFFTSFSLYFLMDREDLGAMDAIRASFDFTRSHAGEVILWFLLSLVTYIVGACLCGVGLIVAIPVVIIGTAYTYKTLNNEPVVA